MSWKKVKLGELCTIEKGATGIQKAIPGEYPLVVTREERKSHNEFQFDDEAVIIPLVSSTGHGHKSLKRIHFQSGKFALGSILCAVIPKDKYAVSAEYLYHYLTLNKEKELVGRMRGMANVTLPIKEIAQIEIPLPPLDEQAAFVERHTILEQDIEGLDTELDHQLCLLKKLRQSLLQDAVQGKLVPQDAADEPAALLLQKIKAEKEALIAAKKLKKEKPLPPIKEEEIPFAIPERWVWCRLGEITSDSLYGPRFSSADYVSDGIPTIRTTDMTDSGSICIKNAPCLKLDPKKVDLYRVNSGDLLITRSGSIGIMAIFRGDYVAIPSAYLIRFRFHEDVVPEYVYHVLKTKQWAEMMMEQSSATAQVNINASKLLQFHIPLPPLAEQHRIVQKLESLMATCDALEQSVLQSKEQAASLLQVALREALQAEARISN